MDKETREKLEVISAISGISLDELYYAYEAVAKQPEVNRPMKELLNDLEKRAEAYIAYEKQKDLVKEELFKVFHAEAIVEWLNEKLNKIKEVFRR